MCYSYDAQPPALPDQFQPSANLESTGSRIILTSQDGTQFAAYRAQPATANGAGIVILPDVRGLFAFYETLARRFADAGFEAITIDYFGRTAGTEPRGADFEFMPYVMQTKAEQIAQDVREAVTQLRQTAGPALKAVFTVGFCFGGMHSLMQATQKHGLSGVIGFYGQPAKNRFGGPTIIEKVGEFECPVLALYGGADVGISQEDVNAFDDALAKAGVEHTVVTYPGAPHSFFDRSFDQYKTECDDSWTRIMAFTSAHTPQTTV